MTARRVVTTGLTIVIASSLSYAQQGVGRDAGAAAPAGSGSISGIVVDDQTSQPIRYADVRLAVGVSQVVAVNADDEGRFRLEGLAAGQYVIYLRSPLYVPMQYGAARPGAAGRLIAVADGAQLSGIVARMTRGGVIAGRVFATSGEPAGNVGVFLMRWGYSATSGQPVLVGAGEVTPRSTDDHGAYRFYGVPPGEYVVQSTAERYRPMGGIEGIGPNDLIYPVSHDDVEAVRRGMTIARALEPSRERLGMTFYPGVARASDAAVVTVAAGQERDNVDFILRPVPLATVRGSFVLPDGEKALRTTVQLFYVGPPPAPTSLPSYAQAEDGSFVSSDVPPGEYVLSAQAFLSSGTNTPTASGAPPILFGTTQVSVDGRDINDVVIALHRGVSVSGRVQFAGEPGSPPQNLRIGLTPVVSDREVRTAPAAVAVDTNGRFTLFGVPPGRYVVSMVPTQLPAVPPGAAPWRVATAMWNGSDLADLLIEIGSDAVSDVAVVLTRAVTSLSGTLRLSDGQPARDYWVVIFATDRAHWRPGSRRVQGMRVRGDGVYRFGSLPAGDYFLAVTGEAEIGRWFDPAFVQELLAVKPVRVTVGDGEQKTQDLQIDGRHEL